MIILEGPNKAGKSTLAEIYSAEYNVSSCYIRDYSDNVWNSSLEQLNHRIVDRCWITEIVYKKRPRLTTAQIM